MAFGPHRTSNYIRIQVFNSQIPSSILFHSFLNTLNFELRQRKGTLWTKFHIINKQGKLFLWSQGNGIVAKKSSNSYEKSKRSGQKGINILGKAEEMLRQKNIEAVLFKGKKMIEKTNLEKLEVFGGEVMKEGERRKNSILPTVLLKQAFPSPRTSSASATTLSTISSSC